MATRFEWDYTGNFRYTHRLLGQPNTQDNVAMRNDSVPISHLYAHHIPSVNALGKVNINQFNQ